MDGSESDTKREVDELTETIRRVHRENQFPMFTGKEPKPTTKDDGKNEGTSVRSQKANDEDATELLETCGYEVVPDVLETDGGTWESMFRVQHTFSIHDAD